jgi:hypothetical protein
MVLMSGNRLEAGWESMFFDINRPALVFHFLTMHATTVISFVSCAGPRRLWRGLLILHFAASDISWQWRAG